VVEALGYITQLENLIESDPETKPYEDYLAELDILYTLIEAIEAANRSPKVRAQAMKGYEEPSLLLALRASPEDPRTLVTLNALEVPGAAGKSMFTSWWLLEAPEALGRALYVTYTLGSRDGLAVLGEVDPRTLETMLKLWEPQSDGVYQSPSVALAAARKLVEGM
jgi:hypothetical protein